MATILVTGAAGSIGAAVVAELTRRRHKIIAFDNAETPLFNLGRYYDALTIVGDIRDRVLRLTVERYRPDVVIHAAALKHVGMCDINVCEAVSVNVAGTIKVAAAAQDFDARLVLVSTDKAVYPTTIMGATKRLAEASCASIADARIVRLVNIWDSNGSIVQVLRELVREGRPVTITDRLMKRFFMSADAAAAIVAEEAMDDQDLFDSRLSVPFELAPKLITDIMAQIMREEKTIVPILDGTPVTGEKLEEEMLTQGERARFPNATVCRQNVLFHRKVARLVKDAAFGRAGQVRYGLMSLAEGSCD